MAHTALTALQDATKDNFGSAIKQKKILKKLGWKLLNSF